MKIGNETYLEYLLDENTLKPETERIKPFLVMPSSKNLKDLRRVIGMLSWHSSFIENKTDKNIPLVKLLHKDTLW